MKISKHFNREEFACKCKCGFDTVDIELLRVLERLREHFAKPVVITSGCRCDAYNKKIGGSSNSQHTKGRAADIVVKGVESYVVYAYLHERYPNKYGIGKYDGWCHIDTRTNGPARW